jgi:hypothetical protein
MYLLHVLSAVGGDMWRCLIVVRVVPSLALPCSHHEAIESPGYGFRSPFFDIPAPAIFSYGTVVVQMLWPVLIVAPGSSKSSSIDGFVGPKPLTLLVYHLILKFLHLCKDLLEPACYQLCSDMSTELYVLFRSINDHIEQQHSCHSIFHVQIHFLWNRASS